MMLNARSLSFIFCSLLTVEAFSTFSAAVKQHKDVYEYIFKEEENSQKGWARAKLCGEAHRALTRVTAWSETDWSGRNLEGMGKETVLMTSSVVALLLARLTGFNSAGVSETKRAHLLIYNCRFGYFIFVPGPGCLPQMGPDDSAECSCMFGCLIGRQRRSVELEWCIFRH